MNQHALLVGIDVAKNPLEVAMDRANFQGQLTTNKDCRN